MLVQVRVDNNVLTYQAPAHVQVGDLVDVPPPPYDISAVTNGWDYEGEVVALDSSYEGSVRSIRRVLTPEEAQQRVARRQAYQKAQETRRARAEAAYAQTYAEMYAAREPVEVDPGDPPPNWRFVPCQPTLVDGRLGARCFARAKLSVAGEAPTCPRHARGRRDQLARHAGKDAYAAVISGALDVSFNPE